MFGNIFIEIVTVYMLGTLTTALIVVTALVIYNESKYKQKKMILVLLTLAFTALYMTGAYMEVKRINDFSFIEANPDGGVVESIDILAQ